MHEVPETRDPIAESDTWPPLGVVLVGNPNVGKSALFGVLTGSYVTVSNYPGTTVEVISGSCNFGSLKLQVQDTPGTRSFLPSSEDERVTRDILLSGVPHAVVLVGDAKNPERTLHLALQACELGIPLVLCLNMTDEAHARGVVANEEALSRSLGVPVVSTVAVRREGVSKLLAALAHPRTSEARVRYPEAVEAALRAIQPHLPDAPISGRAIGLMVLSGDETIADWLGRRATPEGLAAIEDERQRLRRRFREPLALVVAEARRRAADELAATTFRKAPPERPRTNRVGGWLEWASTHPIWGVPILVGVLYLAYLFVGVFGAGTLVGLLEDDLFGRWINPQATRWIEIWLPWGLARDILVGPYGLLTMALTYSLALVFPIVGTFFIAFGLLEDSGYLPRLAVVVNRPFKRLGLNGKAVLPMVLGIGCDTMATLTTRILETRKERLIVILLLALGVPCSAQLTVVLAMLGSLSLIAMGIWLAVVLGTIVLVGALAARVLPGKGSDFVLELPPMRLPRPGNLVVKTLARVEWYLKEAVPLFVLGTLILFVTERLGWLRVVERGARPILVDLLGLPPETAPAFVIGFLRRDFGAAGLYAMSEAGALSPQQVVVAVVVITLFIPCIANFFMIVKERGWRTGLAIASFIFPLALLVGTLVRLFLAALPVPLR